MRNTATIAAGTLIILGLPLLAVHSTTATSPPSTDAPTALTGVEEISITGIGRVTVAIGSPSELRISGPPTAVAQLGVTVEDGELNVEPLSEDPIELGTGEQLQYDIVVENLEDIRLRGEVSMELVGVSGAELGIELADATTATVSDVDLEELDVEVDGTVLLRVSGAAGELDVEARQSGAFDGTELTAGTASVEARDSARVVVNANTVLDVEARDNAIVEHLGSPSQVESRVRDSAVVRPATGSLLPTEPAAVPSTSPTTGPSPSPGTSPVSDPATHQISLAGRAFSPATLEISVGDTVTWINDDDTEHTATAFDGTFDSGELAEGASFSFTFDTPGEYEYRCLFHSEMQGTIIVR